MKILLIDDEQSLQEEIATYLKMEEHTVVSAANGQAGWDLFVQSPDEFDVIITDIRMPVLDGLALMKKLRKDHHEIPIIIITGHGDLDASIQALRLGAFDFLLKPFDPQALDTALLKLKTLLSAKKPTTEIAACVEHIRLTIPSKTKLCVDVLDYLKNYYGPLCQKHDINVIRIGVCVMEALTNAIQHGNLEVPSSLKQESWDKFFTLIQERENDSQFTDRQVTIQYRVNKEQFEIEVEDEGKGFDQAILPENYNEDTLLSSGRGILLIRSYMDDVKWDKQGSKIIMTKKL
ncbi:MAG: response regulator [SAR324 cluster bacterium]|nr:response regulator [SAR324 cluster bacterium]